MSERAYWIREQRGGYGFTQRIPVVVLSRTAKRVRVLVPLRSGAAVIRSVEPANLRPRTDPDAIDEAST